MHAIGSPQLVTRMNAAAVVDLVRREGMISRVDIAHTLGLSTATVSRLACQLLDADILREIERGASRGGRRPVLLAYNPGAALLIGIDVGGTKIAGGLSDLDGKLLARHTRPTWPDDGTPGGLDATLALIGDLLAEGAALGVPVRGIGIGIPGVTRHSSGVVVWAPGLEWRELALAALVEERFGIPSYLENDVNLAVLGEHWRGAGRDVRHVVGVFIGTGIGAGIIIEGRILHGANDAAGEVGYLLLDRADLRRPYPGFGAFEGKTAGPGIARRAAAVLANAPLGGGILRGPTPSAREVVAAATAGDPLAGRIIDETLDSLAQALGNLACVLNPQRIIIGGAVGLGLAPWHAALRERLLGRVPHPPEIVAAALGVDAGLIGAIALAQERAGARAVAEETINAIGSGS